MRWHWMVAAALLGGCSHEAPATTEAATTPAAYGAQARDDFSIAYDAIKRGVENTATAGKYALRGVGGGIVQVTDASKEGLDKTGARVEDAWIKTKIESKYALDKRVRLSDLNVTSDGGVVRIAGLVDDPGEAERAIRLALDTEGVAAVDANIQMRGAALPSPQPSY